MWNGVPHGSPLAGSPDCMIPGIDVHEGAIHTGSWVRALFLCLHFVERIF